jgi:hypothetical protein
MKSNSLVVNQTQNSMEKGLTSNADSSSAAIVNRQIQFAYCTIKNFSFFDWLSLINCLAVAGSFLALYALSENIFTLLVYAGIILSVLPSFISILIKKERSNFKLASLIIGLLVLGVWLLIITL